MTPMQMYETLKKAKVTHIAHWPQDKEWDYYKEGEEKPDDRFGNTYDGGILVPLESDGALGLIYEMYMEGSISKKDEEGVLNDVRS